MKKMTELKKEGQVNEKPQSVNENKMNDRN